MGLVEDTTLLADELGRNFEDVRTEITTFPSGAVSLFVRSGGRCFNFDYMPSYDMFGVDELRSDDAFNSGYRFGFRGFEPAKAKLLELLREASPGSQSLGAELSDASRLTVPS